LNFKKFDFLNSKEKINRTQKYIILKSNLRNEELPKDEEIFNKGSKVVPEDSKSAVYRVQFTDDSLWPFYDCLLLDSNRFS
jgi:hypothetical protein